MSDFTYELPAEKDFFKTLVEYATHDREDKIVDLLNKCTMSFKETNTFTEKIWDTYWCSIVFSLPISDLPKVSQEILSKIKKYCNDLLPPICGFLIKEINFVPQIIQQTTEQQPELEVVFEEQKIR